MSTPILGYLGPQAVEEARGSGPIRWSLGDYVGHFSPSNIGMALRCRYQWQQRYVRGLKERPGESPFTGTTVHAALERNFEQKIESHEDLPLADLLEWYSEVGFPTTLQIEQTRAGSEVQWDKASGPERARDRGRKMLAEYQRVVAPRVQPLSVEDSFTTEAFALPVPMIGRYDVIREDSVVDIKTGKRSSSEPKAEWRIQAGIYSEVAGKPVEFHSLTVSDADNVKLVTPLESEALLVQPSFAQREQMRLMLRSTVALLSLYMEMFGPDEDWPADGIFHPWACGYCGFRAGCPAWTA